MKFQRKTPGANNSEILEKIQRASVAIFPKEFLKDS